MEGLRHHIRRHVALAQEFAGWVEASPDFELVAPAPLNLVCFAHRAGDDFNRRLLERLNQSGKLYLTHTVLNGRYTLRLCVGQTHTEAAHVRQAWELIQQNARDSASSPKDVVGVGGGAVGIKGVGRKLEELDVTIAEEEGLTAVVGVIVPNRARVGHDAVVMPIPIALDNLGHRPLGDDGHLDRLVGGRGEAVISSASAGET